MMRRFQPFAYEGMFDRRPNRLGSEAYTTGGAFSLTVCTADRRHHLCRPETVSKLHALLFREAAHLGIEVDAYCFMPDHLHLLVTSNGADVRMLMKRFKQVSSYWFRQTTGSRLWQKGYYDHVVRSDEAMDRIAEYILGNPVRKGWCGHWSEYPHSWSRWHSDDL